MPRYCSEIPRARFRILFFVVLTAVLVSLHWWPAACLAGLGSVVGLVSLSVARTRGRRLALSFVTFDWLCLSLIWTITGGVSGPLVYTLPLLLLAHLVPTVRGDRLYVVAPLAAGIAVLLIADSGPGGDGLVAGLKLAGLAAAGIVPAFLLRRGSTRRQRTTRVRRSTARGDPVPVDTDVDVDPTTGLPGLPRVTPELRHMLRRAGSTHEGLGVVCVRLRHWESVHRTEGRLAAEAAAAAAARHLRGHLGPDDRAFRVCGDTFLLVLRGRTGAQTSRLAAEVSGDLSARRLERSGDTLAATCGISSYPARRSVEELLTEAAAAAQHCTDDARADDLLDADGAPS